MVHIHRNLVLRALGHRFTILHILALSSLNPRSAHPLKHDSSPLGASRSSTAAWTSALTSAFVLAFMTVTLAKHPALESTTVVSSGSVVLPHVSTSVALLLFSSRVKIHWKSAGLAHSPFGWPEDENVVGPKLTFKVTPAGRIGRAAGARSVRVKLVVRVA